MALCLVLEDESGNGRGGGVSLSCQLGAEIIIGRSNIDKNEKSLSKVKPSQFSSFEAPCFFNQSRGQIRRANVADGFAMTVIRPSTMRQRS
jgi:hypothetical protein